MTPSYLKGKTHLLPIVPGPLIIEHSVEDGTEKGGKGAHLISSELSVNPQKSYATKKLHNKKGYSSKIVLKTTMQKSYILQV